MEDEEVAKNVNEPSLTPEVEFSTMEDKPLDFTNTEQCQFVPESLPELGDYQLLAAKSPVEPVADEAVSTVAAEAELDDSAMVGAESPIAAEDVDDVVDEVEGDLEKSVSESVDSQLVGDESENAAKEGGVEGDLDKSVSELVDSQFVGDELENAAKDGGVEGDVDKSVSELVDSQLVGDESENAAKDVEAEGEADADADAEAEAEAAAEQLEIGLGKSIPDLDDSQLEWANSPVPGLNESRLVGVESPIVDEVVVVEEDEEEIPKVGTENEVEVQCPELEEDSQVVGTESSIAAKEDSDEEAMAEGETRVEDTEMDADTEMGNEAGSSSIPEMDNLHNIGAESPIVAGDDEDDDDDEDVAVEAGAEAGEEEEEDETPMVDTEMEIEMDVAEMAETETEKGVGGAGKRKRGKNSKASTRAPPARKVIEEDVCFICFDGGDLVLCDRRGCPKAYHPSCVNRDEAFFRAKGRWNCGWHLCSICEKNAHYMCFTCTFSLCKACIKDAVILCVRGNKGFCETCMKTVLLIENNEQANKEDRVDFDDKSSWEYLFKDYWIDLKQKLSLSSVELAQAKNPWKGSDLLSGKHESPEEVFDANNDQGSGSDSSENLEVVRRKRRQSKKRSKPLTKEDDLPSSTAAIGAEETAIPGNTEWASQDLLEFVMHMKDGDRSVLSQYDVQALLLEYIKRNKLRDPRRKSQIVCDARLTNIFGKTRVAHFEMLKLIESHFLIKEDSQIDDIQGTVVDTEVNRLEADGAIDAPSKGSKDRKRKMRKKGDGRGPQSNLDDYAAIDMHNINLIYLRRKLVEDLLEDMERFPDKVDGTFVRIRISGSNQKQDIYRLVQVVGTRKAAEPYKVGKKTTDLVLEILNLNKTEVVSIDTISNQEFTEDECKRLRQSIKCGLINRLTVGGILDKAMEVQAARVNDWLESEVVRLSHLRDRASEKGRRKEYPFFVQVYEVLKHLVQLVYSTVGRQKECVEKLQLLKTPEERRLRLEEIPEIHADPNMDPSYESEEDDIEMEDNKKELYPTPRGSGFSRKGMEPISPRGGSFSSTDSWSGTRKNSGKNWELNRNNSSKNFSNKGEESALVGDILNKNAWNQGRDKDVQANMEKLNAASNSETVGRNSHPFVRSESFSGPASDASQASLPGGLAETAAKVNETEKMWRYQDPAGKVQGPFSIVQLRKWNNTGYFPADLKIWRTTEKQEDSILLADALAGRFEKELPPMDNNSMKAPTVLSSTHAAKAYGASLQKGKEGEGGERLNFDHSHGVRNQLELSSSSGWSTPSVEVPKADRWGSDNSRNDPLNLPSPTPKSSTPVWTEGPTHSAAVATSDSGQLTPSSLSSSINQTGSKEHTALESLAVSTPVSVMNSGTQLMGFENDPSSSLTGSIPAPNSEQGILVGPTTALPTQTIVMGPVETHGWGSGSVQNQEMVPPSQPAVSDSQTWVPNPSFPVPVQPAAYGHWGGIPSTVPNPSGNFQTPGFNALPQPEPWRPPVASNQPNIQPVAPPSVPWGMGVAESNANAVWVPMQGNPNMGWAGPLPPPPPPQQPVATNMNWVPAVQGPVPGTVNPGWVASPGNPGAMVQGLPPGNPNPGWAAQPSNVNPGWAAQAGNPGSGNGNAGWVPSTGNPGNVQGPALGNVNPVWAGPTGNPGTTVQGPAPPGNANLGWGAPPGNSGMRGNEKQHNGDRFSGQRNRSFQGRDSGFGGGGGGRRWNRQQSFGSGGGHGGNGQGSGGHSGGGQGSGQLVCGYYQSGHCKKGASCDRMHT
ncbi:unnamed protein product [Camellia sinensis]